MSFIWISQEILDYCYLWDREDWSISSTYMCNRKSYGKYTHTNQDH